MWAERDSGSMSTGLRSCPTARQCASGRRFVLLHGGPGSFDHSYFKPDFARLSEVAQVVYLDLPGHGRSEWGDPAGWTFELAADSVRDFCDVVGIARPVVYGHSLGGMVAMLYAARHADHPSALILASTLARFDLGALVESFRRLGGDDIALIAERVYGGGSESVTIEEWARCWKLFGPWVTGEEEKARTVVNVALNPPGLELMHGFDVLEQLARIRRPTLVCVGEVDPVTPVAASREIAAALPEGVGRLEVIEGAGHFAWKDAPDRYWPLLTDFVAAVAR
jgi:pimeloyl-ACP methyl ester carboxylesterase